MGGLEKKNEGGRRGGRGRGGGERVLRRKEGERRKEGKRAWRTGKGRWEGKKGVLEN